MRIIFCDNGLNAKEVDEMYAEEYQAAKAAGLEISLISFEELKSGNLQKALKHIPQVSEKELAIYRGWMLTPPIYRQLYEALALRDIVLINQPEAYLFCHYLPENYKVIQDFTPLTTFKKLNSEFDIQDFAVELDIFENKPIMIKDFVKSQKHYWEEACYIPDASNREKAATVIQKFLELQSNDLNEGLVFREFVPLQALTLHSKSRMPLTKEFRLFILYGRIINTYHYWDEGDYEDLKPDLGHFEALLPRIKSNFFTMDIAQKTDGDWIIIELGDGQVAGLPDHANKKDFYQVFQNLSNV